MIISVTCWRCGEYGHGYLQCQRPPARKPAELQARIKQIIIRWDAGNGFSRSAKKALIEIETREYERERTRK